METEQSEAVTPDSTYCLNYLRQIEAVWLAESDLAPMFEDWNRNRYWGPRFIFLGCEPNNTWKISILRSTLHCNLSPNLSKNWNERSLVMSGYMHSPMRDKPCHNLNWKRSLASRSGATAHGWTKATTWCLFMPLLWSPMLPTWEQKQL